MERPSLVALRLQNNTKRPSCVMLRHNSQYFFTTLLIISIQLFFVSVVRAVDTKLYDHPMPFPDQYEDDQFPSPDDYIVEPFLPPADQPQPPLMVPMIPCSGIKWQTISHRDGDSRNPQGSTTLSLCCGLETFWLAEVGQGWVLKDPVFKDVPFDEIKDVEVSSFTWCKDGTQMEGHFEQEGCYRKNGYKLDLERLPGYRFDRWYVMCLNYTYTEDHESGAKSEKCRSCSLEYMCPGFDCSQSENWYSQNVEHVHGDEFTITYNTGHPPFPLNITTEIVQLREKDDWSHPRNKIFRQTEELLPNEKKQLVIRNLSKLTWYRIETCANLYIPEGFLIQHDMKGKLGGFSRKCEESYQVQTSNHSIYGGANSRIVSKIDSPLLVGSHANDASSSTTTIIGSGYLANLAIYMAICIFIKIID